MNIYGGKREMVMTNEYDWEKKGRSWSCRCCGQFIKNNEKFYLVVILGSDIREIYPKEGNFIVHKVEFDELAKELNDEYLAIKAILSKKRPRTKNRTPIDETMVEKFYEVARKQRLSIVKETRNRIYFKPCISGRVGDFVYDKRSQKVFYNGRGFNGLFDRMFLHEIISRIHEELHDLNEGYRVEKVLKKTKKTVDKMMNS